MNHINNEKAVKFREKLQSFLRRFIKDRDSKEKLASYLGQSVASVDAMLYQAQGGLDSWFYSMCYVMGLSEEAMLESIDKFSLFQSSHFPQTAEDVQWVQMMNQLSAKEKKFWMKIISESKLEYLPVEK